MKTATLIMLVLLTPTAMGFDCYLNGEQDSQCTYWSFDGEMMNVLQTNQEKQDAVWIVGESMEGDFKMIFRVMKQRYGWAEFIIGTTNDPENPYHPYRGQSVPIFTQDTRYGWNYWDDTQNPSNWEKGYHCFDWSNDKWETHSEWNTMSFDEWHYVMIERDSDNYYVGVSDSIETVERQGILERKLVYGDQNEMWPYWGFVIPGDYGAVSIEVVSVDNGQDTTTTTTTTTSTTIETATTTTTIPIQTIDLVIYQDKIEVNGLVIYGVTNLEDRR